MLLDLTLSRSFGWVNGGLLPPPGNDGSRLGFSSFFLLFSALTRLPRWETGNSVTLLELGRQKKKKRTSGNTRRTTGI